MKLLSGSQDHKTGGITAVGAVTSTPVTKIADTSSANTTFTATRVTDSSAWSLTGVAIGDTAKTSDGYRGKILSTGTNIVNVNRWVHDSGYEGVPANTGTVTVHRLNYVRKLLLTSLTTNTQLIYVGLNGAVTSADYPIAVANNLTVNPDGNDQVVDVTKIFILSASGTQYLAYVQGGQSSAGGIASGVLPGSVSLTTGVAGILPLVNGGTNKAITASANKLVYCDTDSFELLATAASGVLVTSAGSVPSIATDIPTAVTIGSAYIYRAGGTDVAPSDGGAPATQTIRFHPAEFIPSPDGVNNSCTISAGYDRTNYRSYFEITSGSATQDYDMVAIVKLPTDFISFAANAISLDIYTVDYATSVATVTVIKNDNSTDVNASSVIATANLVWQTKTVAPAITGYAAGDNVKIIFHIGTGDTASDLVRIARVFLTYNTR